MNESEDILTDKLSGEEKKRFLQYVDAWAAVNGKSTLDGFKTGLRLGAWFAFDTYVTSNAPNVDYLKDEIYKPKIPNEASAVLRRMLLNNVLRTN